MSDLDTNLAVSATCGAIQLNVILELYSYKCAFQSIIMRRFALILLFSGAASAFCPSPKRPHSLTAQKALWRAFVPRQDHIEEQHKSFPDTQLFQGLTAFIVTITLSLPAYAVSGGGLDFANLDISAQDFSNTNYKGKDFTQVIAKGTNFMNSNLQGCRFYKAFLVSNRVMDMFNVFPPS
jgi:uncharacterized protein YjbI with pentapeptide repeats